MNNHDNLKLAYFQQIVNLASPLSQMWYIQREKGGPFFYLLNFSEANINLRGLGVL